MLKIQRQTLRAVSPWVQRALARNGETRRSTVGFSSLNSTHTARLLQRSNRHAENGIGLKTHLGTLEPRLISRFSSTISDHFMPLATRHETQGPSASNPAPERIDMPLAEGASMSDHVGSESDQNVLTSYPQPFVTQAGDGGASDSPLQRSIEYSVPDTATIQRSATPSTPQPRTIQEIRDLLERNLSSRRGQSHEAPPVVSSVPPPSPSTVRRVARVEEFDPIAMAMRNEMREDKLPEERPQGTPPADRNEQIEQPAVQRRLESPRQTRPVSPPPAPDFNQQLPSIRNDLVGPNGEFSPLQRIRQARAAQLQRVQATDRKESPTTTPSDNLPGAPAASPVEQAAAAPVRAKPSRSAIQRRVTEMSTTQSGEPDNAPSSQVPAAKPEIPLSDPPVLPVHTDTTPQLQRETSDTTGNEPAVNIPAERQASTPQRESKSEVNEQPVLPNVVTHPADVGKPVVQREPSRDVRPLQDTIESDISLPESSEAPSTSSQDQVQRMPAQPVVQSDEPPTGSLSAQQEAQAIQRSQAPEPAEPFAEHIIARALTHAKLPVTQHAESEAPLQRSIDTSREPLDVHAPLPPIRQDAEPRPHGQTRTLNMPPAEESQVPQANRPAATRSIQRTPGDTEQVTPDTSSVLSDSDITSHPPTLPDIAQATEPRGNVQRKPASQKPVINARSSLPLRTSGIQRQAAHPQSVNMGLKPPHTVLPQVQVALSNTAPALDIPRVNRDDFTLRRVVAPEQARSRTPFEVRLPLLQRSAAEGRPVIAPTAIHRDVERISPHAAVPASETLVMRKTKPSSSGTDVSTDTKKKDSASAAVTSESDEETATEKPSMPEPPDVNQLARDILPLIKRMLAVERERIRGT